MSDDWKNGYDAGYVNGYEAGYNKGKEEKNPPNPYQQGQHDWRLTKNVGTTCQVCGRVFETGKAYGYVCGYYNCPSKTYCSTSTVATSVGTTSSAMYAVNTSSAIPDGLSYEEIYGSVVYQQGRKNENS